MHFDFEAAAISISIGVVVAVLLQGTLLDHADAFEAGALLASLAARMPLSDRAASSDPQ